MPEALGTYSLYMQAVVNDVFTPDLFISVLVLMAVSLAAIRGSAGLAALAATAPTGVPLSMWLVYKAQRWGARRWDEAAGVGHAQRFPTVARVPAYGAPPPPLSRSAQCTHTDCLPPLLPHPTLPWRLRDAARFRGCMCHAGVEHSN
jgi:hypothetical protein